MPTIKKTAALQAPLRHILKGILYAYLIAAALLLLAATLLFRGTLSAESSDTVIALCISIGVFVSVALTLRRQQTGLLVQAIGICCGFLLGAVILMLLLPRDSSSQPAFWGTTAATAIGSIGGVLININKKHNITKRKRKTYYR